MVDAAVTQFLARVAVEHRDLNAARKAALRLPQEVVRERQPGTPAPAKSEERLRAWVHPGGPACSKRFWWSAAVCREGTGVKGR